MADPITVSELIDWFEQNFICCVGPAATYFDIQTGPHDGVGEYPVAGVLYQTYAVSCRDWADAEKKLVAAMYADFGQLVGTSAHKTVLFWRYPEKIRIRTDPLPVFGKPLVTQEAIEDGLAEIPAGSVLGYDCIYYEDCGTARRWSLAARLCIPAMDWMMPTFAFITRKAEGEATHTI